MEGLGRTRSESSSKSTKSNKSSNKKRSDAYSRNVQSISSYPQRSQYSGWSANSSVVKVLSKGPKSLVWQSSGIGDVYDADDFESGLRYSTVPQERYKELQLKSEEDHSLQRLLDIDEEDEEDFDFSP